EGEAGRRRAGRMREGFAFGDDDQRNPRQRRCPVDLSDARLDVDSLESWIVRKLRKRSVEDVSVGRPCRTEQHWELLWERIDEDDGADITGGDLCVEADEETAQRVGDEDVGSFHLRCRKEAVEVVR